VRVDPGVHLMSLISLAQGNVDVFALDFPAHLSFYGLHSHLLESSVLLSLPRSRITTPLKTAAWEAKFFLLCPDCEEGNMTPIK